MEIPSEQDWIAVLSSVADPELEKVILDAGGDEWDADFCQRIIQECDLVALTGFVDSLPLADEDTAREDRRRGDRSAKQDRERTAEGIARAMEAIDRSADPDAPTEIGSDEEQQAEAEADTRSAEDLVAEQNALNDEVDRATEAGDADAAAKAQADSEEVGRAIDKQAEKGGDSSGGIPVKAHTRNGKKVRAHTRRTS